MANENKVRKGFPPNVLRICIDWFEQDLKGRAYTKISEEAIIFENCKDLFLKTDILFDQCGYPQTFQEKRRFLSDRRIGSFAVPRVCISDEELQKQEGKILTVDVLINSRRRAGWQGSAKALDEEIPFEFQGELELLYYISRVLTGKLRQRMNAEGAVAAGSK